MKTAEYCECPPRLAADVEIVARNDGSRPGFILGSSAVGHYLTVGPAERQILQSLDGQHTPAEIWPDQQGLARFLKKLDEIGTLAGSDSVRDCREEGNRARMWRRA